MPHAKRSKTMLGWLISLVNPPPLQSMTRLQKTARVFVFTTATVVICILSSMLAALAIFALQKARHMFNGEEEFMGDLAIILVSMLVNALCVMVLLKVKHADQKLIPPDETLKAPENHS